MWFWHRNYFGDIFPTILDEKVNVLRFAEVESDFCSRRLTGLLWLYLRKDQVQDRQLDVVAGYELRVWNQILFFDICQGQEFF